MSQNETTEDLLAEIEKLKSIINLIIDSANASEDARDFTMWVIEDVPKLVSEKLPETKSKTLNTIIEEAKVEINNLPPNTKLMMERNRQRRIQADKEE